MIYPDERLAAFSKYSYAEICATLDQWAKTEKRFDAVINAVDYATLPQDILDEITWLEPVSCPTDGTWHRSGNAEMFPVKKWNKLIKKHEKLASRIENLKA